MAQDIRELFKNDAVSGENMPENHQARFLEKLDKAMPVAKRKPFSWLKVAASIVVLLGLGFGAFKFFETPPIESDNSVARTLVVETKSLGDISPGLKKVEDYYLASINLELSKIEYAPETKELFDGYLSQLNELDKEYKRLSVELTESGPSELTINALIDNLKLRLNLLYRLRNQIKSLKTSNTNNVVQSI